MATSDKTWTIEAEIMPKRGVNDPQGEAVLSGLKQLGFANVNRVRVGKVIRVNLTAESEDAARAAGQEMCEKLLANPVIEEFELTVRAAEEE
ncbi:MAG TPA: phosphoribosylformylglycinamidine synthase subunit PurS [Thermomicrobiales bacterium]|nr:phosphoribosylformylglycinamidine synthase subunit PurS [Thermomicrobiales bacterium]